jgi:hypothetical protein
MVHSVLPVALFGYKMWSFALREEHRLRKFVNRMLRRIFGPKGKKVKGGRRKLRR